MVPREAFFETAARHVRDVQANIDRQRQLIERLRALGHSTKEAEALLATFLHIQRGHEEHLASPAVAISGQQRCAGV